jgi:hypothetical protein
MDDYSTGATMAMSGVFIVFAIVLGLAVHLFVGYCFKRIAEKAGEEDTSIWWIPIVNYLLIFRVAGKPGWWLLLLLVPFANIIVLFVTWIEVSQRLGHGALWGVLAVIIGIVGIPFLAFSEPQEPALA